MHTLLFEPVRLVADPQVDDIVSVENVAVLVNEILLSESRALLHPHVASGIRYLEKAWLEARGHTQ